MLLNAYCSGNLMHLWLNTIQTCLNLRHMPTIFITYIPTCHGMNVLEIQEKYFILHEQKIENNF